MIIDITHTRDRLDMKVSLTSLPDGGGGRVVSARRDTGSAVEVAALLLPLAAPHKNSLPAVYVVVAGFHDPS